MRRPSDDDETIRLLSGRAPAADAAPVVSGRRRTGLALALLAGAAGLATVGAGLAWLWPPGGSGPQRLGPRRLLPPVLRTRFRGADLVFVLAWRSEQDASDPPEAPAPRERLELLAFEGAGMAPHFEVWLLSAPIGQLPESGLIAEQAGTVWLWVGGLGAVSAVDGTVLADQDGIAELNPDAPRGLIGSRRLWQVREALTLDRGGLGAALRIDPRDFRVSPVTTPPVRPLPPIHAAAALSMAGAASFRAAEARLGEAWFGLVPETQRLAEPLVATAGRYLAAPAPGAAQALWRGAPRMVPTAGPGNAAGRPRLVERIFDLAPLDGMAGLQAAGFLTAGGPAPVVLADPPGLLLLHGLPVGGLGLMRLGPEGEVAWRSRLPIGVVHGAMPGPGHLLLLGGPLGAGITESGLVSVGLADGAVAERSLNA